MAKTKSISAIDLIQQISGATKGKVKVLGEHKDDYATQYWIDTGHVLLNCQMSGDPYKGMPGDISVLFKGEKSSGKSLIAKILILNFQKEFDGVGEFYETEGAMNSQELEDFGIDLNKIIVTDVSHTVDLKLSIYEKLKAFKRYNKWMIIVDSVANLPSSEEFTKAEKKDDTAVVGKKAIEVNSLYRVVNVEANRKHIPMIYINRDYASMKGGMFVSDVEKSSTSGGKGNEFSPSIILKFTPRIIYIKQKNKKDDGEGELKDTTKKVPIALEITSDPEKNRRARQNKPIKMIIHNKYGLLRYSGLSEYAIEAGLLEKKTIQGNGVTKFYVFGDDTIGYKNILQIPNEKWEECLKNGLAKYLREEFKQVNLFEPMKNKNKTKEKKDVK